MITAELLIFDLDGTIADTLTDISNSVNFALTQSGFACLKETQIVKYIGSGARQLFQDILKKPDVDEILQIYLKHYSENFLNYTKLYPGTGEILEYYKNKKKVVISNKTDKFVNGILEGLNISSCFDSVIGAGKMEKLKPDPQSVISMMKKFNIAPDKTIIIGDGINDIQAGNNAEIHTCAAGYGFTPKKQLMKYSPEFYIDSLIELKKIVC